MLGVLGASGTIGVVIPPSLALILYGIVTEQSVPRLFLAGILPGLLQAGAFFLWVLYYARRKDFPAEPPTPMRDRLRVTLRALPAMLVPAVVMVGIYGGIVTIYGPAGPFVGAGLSSPPRTPRVSRKISIGFQRSEGGLASRGVALSFTGLAGWPSGSSGLLQTLRSARTSLTRMGQSYRVRIPRLGPAGPQAQASNGRLLPSCP